MNNSSGTIGDALLLEIVRDIKDNIFGKLARLGGGLPVDTASRWVAGINDVELLQTLETLVDCAMVCPSTPGTRKKASQGSEMIRLFTEYNTCGATITDRQAGFLLQRIARAALTSEENSSVWKGFLELALVSPVGEGYLLLVTLGALLHARHSFGVVSRATECLLILGDYGGAAGLLGWLHEKAISTLSPGSAALDAATGILNLTEGLLTLRERHDDERRLKALGNSLAAMERTKVVGVSAAIEKARESLRSIADGGGIPIIYGEPGAGKRHMAEFFHCTADPGEPVFHVDLKRLSRGGLMELMCGRTSSVLLNLRPPRGILTMAGRGTVILYGAEAISPGDIEFLRTVLTRREYRPVDDILGHYLPVRARFAICFETPDPSFPGTLSAAVPAGFAASIGAVPVYLPPLRSRYEDIPWLADHFVNTADLPETDDFQAGRELKSADRRVLDKACRERLKAYFWPRNVEELKRVAEAMAVLSSGRVIHETFLPERILGRYRRVTEAG